MVKPGYVKDFDTRAGKLVEHKKVACVINQNVDRVFPEFPKVTQGRQDMTCMALSLGSCIKAIREKEIGAVQGTKLSNLEGALDVMVEEAAKFSEIVAPIYGKGSHAVQTGYTVREICSHLVLMPGSVYG